ncbi:MAG TPA: hypothetical protein VIY48_20385 [Candidatus Paceibacterota bacterium]
MSKYHLFTAADEATLQTDPVLSRFYIIGGGEPGDPPSTWDMSVCFTYEEVYLDNVPQDGFWMIVATDIADTSLAQHPNCKIAFDGDNGLPLGGMFTVNEVLALTFSPVPAGAVLPWQQ